MDIIGGLWMAVVVASGAYAWRHDMNISYICTWGVLCAINFVFDVISQVVPALMGLISFALLAVVVRVSIPVVYFLGTVYAWHLYHDYEEAQGHNPLVAYDPMGKFFDRYDPSAHIPLMKSGGLPGPGGFGGVAAGAVADGYMSKLFSGHKQEYPPQEPLPPAAAAPPASSGWSLFNKAPDFQEHYSDAQRRGAEQFGEVQRRGAEHYSDMQRRGAEAYGSLSAARPGMEQTAQQGHEQAQEAGKGFFGALRGR